MPICVRSSKAVLLCQSSSGRSGLTGRSLPSVPAGPLCCSCALQRRVPLARSTYSRSSLEVMAQASQAQPSSNSLHDLDKWASLRLYQQVGMKLPRWPMMLLEHSGSGVLWLPGVPLLWLATQQSPTTRLFWANCFLLLWVDIALVGALKGLFRRRRPIYNHAGDFVVVVAVDQYSFPSGHAARVSALAAFACVCCAHHSWGIVTAAAAWALTVAVSRAAMGRHYLGDITAGLLLGLVTVAIVTKGTFASRGFWIEKATSEKLQQQALEIMGSWLSRWKPA